MTSCRLYLSAALDQSHITDTLGPLRESGGWAAPAQFVDVVEQRRIDPERGELLEEQREFTLLAEHRGWQMLDGAVFVQHPRGRGRADARDAGVSVRRIADERQVIGNEVGRDPKLRAHAVGVSDIVAPA